MRKQLLAAALFVASTAASADVAPARITYAEYGFTIDGLSAPDEGREMQVLAFDLPPSGGFAPNVNVRLQPFAGSLAEYLDVSKSEFARMKLTLIGERREANAATMEYAGEMQGFSLHFYARAARRRTGGIILATGTATDAQWPKVAAQLKRSVDSLRLTP